MKFFGITLLFVILALACCLSTTYAEDAKRGLRRPPGKLASKTSTTTANPAEEEEGDYPDNGEEPQEGEEVEEAEVSTTTTTTEAPKRIGPVIRPFRSNDAFLNSLKRRQMNAKKAKAEKQASKPVKAAVSHNAEDGEEEEEAAPASAPKGFSKPNSALSRNRKAGKPTKPEPVEEPAEEGEAEPKEEEAKPKRPLAGRLALRKRN
ncbi:uncharacterized protein [Musca autumnalis]|uniref:uncharacterized protein n=1 Tax=Musca autumnalis TaxID=221902 RepID=UPI003CF67655